MSREKSHAAIRPGMSSPRAAAAISCGDNARSNIFGASIFPLKPSFSWSLGPDRNSAVPPKNFTSNDSSTGLADASDTSKKTSDTRFRDRSKAHAMVVQVRSPSLKRVRPRVGSAPSSPATISSVRSAESDRRKPSVPCMSRHSITVCGRSELRDDHKFKTIVKLSGGAIFSATRMHAYEPCCEARGAGSAICCNPCAAISAILLPLPAGFGSAEITRTMCASTLAPVALAIWNLTISPGRTERRSA